MYGQFGMLRNLKKADKAEGSRKMELEVHEEGKVSGESTSKNFLRQNKEIGFLLNV